MKPSSQGKLTPSTHRRHRQASDAKWRANMYVCYNLLKHTSNKPDLKMVNTKGGKITRIGALNLALQQLPVIEGVVSQLLEAKNRAYGTCESISTIKQEFQEVTNRVCRHQIDSKRVRVQPVASVPCTVSTSDKGSKGHMPNSTSTCGSDLSLAHAPSERSVSRTSIAGSYISDISSAINEVRSTSSSPNNSSSSFHQFSQGVLDDVPSLQMSPVYSHSPIHMAELDNSLDGENFVDLERSSPTYQSRGGEGRFSLTQHTSPKSVAFSSLSVPKSLGDCNLSNVDFSFSTQDDEEVVHMVLRSHTNTGADTELNYLSATDEMSDELEMYPSHQIRISDGKGKLLNSDPMMSQTGDQSQYRLQQAWLHCKVKEEPVNQWEMENLDLGVQWK